MTDKLLKRIAFSTLPRPVRKWAGDQLVIRSLKKLGIYERNRRG